MKSIIVIVILIAVLNCQSVNFDDVKWDQLRSLDFVKGSDTSGPRQVQNNNELDAELNTPPSGPNRYLKVRTYKAADTVLQAIEKAGILRRIPKDYKLVIEFRALKDAKISNTGLRALGRALRNVTTLANITVEILEAKNVGRAGVVALLEPLAKNNLQEFNLTLINSVVDDRALQTLTTALNKKPSLQRMSFSCQRCDSLTRRGANSIGTLIKSLPNLRTLNLDFQKCKKIGDTSATNIGNGLKGNRLNYLEINFRDTRVNPRGLKALSAALRSTSNIPRGRITDVKGNSLDVSRFITTNQ